MPTTPFGWLLPGPFTVASLPVFHPHRLARKVPPQLLFPLIAFTYCRVVLFTIKGDWRLVKSDLPYQKCLLKRRDTRTSIGWNGC